MTPQHPAAPEGGVWPKGRLVDHPQPGKVWVQVPHRNDLGSDWIEVDTTTPAAPEGETDASGSRTIRVKVTVDTDELREWAGKHADAGRHGVAHVLYKAANDGESLSEQAIREAVANRHASLLADLDALRERVRVVEGERDAARGDLVFSRQTTTNVMEALADSGAETLAALARAESAEAAHAALVDRMETLADEFDAKGRRGSAHFGADIGDTIRLWIARDPRTLAGGGA